MKTGTNTQVPVPSMMPTKHKRDGSLCVHLHFSDKKRCYIKDFVYICNRDINN